MAGIICHAGQSGLNTYAVIRNSLGEVWNGSSFETFTDANWATYDVSLIEQSNSGFYKGNFPSGITLGVYTVTLHVGSVALGDEVIGFDSEYVWDGSSRFTYMSFTSGQQVQINAEVLDVMNSQPLSELTSVPSATPVPFEALMLLYQWLRNNTQATATTRSIKNDAGVTIGSATVSDDGTTFSQGKLA